MKQKKPFQVIVYVDGELDTKTPQILHFTSAGAGVKELMQAYNPEMNKNVTIKLKAE